MAAGCYEIIGLGANRVSVPHRAALPSCSVRCPRQEPNERGDKGSYP
jgi:hypothetical protein